MVGQGSGNSLTNPPGGISAELEATGKVKALHSLHQADIALLNQIQEGQAPTHKALSNAGHKAQIGLGQPVLGVLALPFNMAQKLFIKGLGFRHSEATDIINFA